MDTVVLGVWVPYENRGSRLPGGSYCGLRFEVLSSLALLKVGRLQPTDRMFTNQVHLYIWGLMRYPCVWDLGALEWPALQGALLDWVQDGWS